MVDRAKAEHFGCIPPESGGAWTDRRTFVIGDAHSGLKMAIESILQGAVWQRCRVHFVRDALAPVPKQARQMLAATIRPGLRQWPLSGLPQPASPRALLVKCR